MLEEDQVAGQPSTNLDLGPSLKLGPDIEHFLWEQAAMQEEEEGSDPLWETSVTEYENWIVEELSSPHAQLVVGAGGYPRNR